MEEQIAKPIGLISIAIVAYNEEACLGDVLNDILAQDYPRNRIEILLIDSASSDSTKSLMEEFAKSEFSSDFARILILDNEKKILPAGCNIALSCFSGDALIRVDAHARIPSDFIRRNAEVLQEGEWVCGGPRPTVASPDTPWAETLLLAENSAFGSSIADYRSTSKKEYVSSAFHAAFRREVVEEVGRYDERLARTEDNDYFYRVKEAGYRVRFDRRIHSEQIARNTFNRMVRQKYGNGYWIGRTLFIQPKCFHLYHYAPLVFVVGILALIAVGCLWTIAPLVVCAIAYFAIATALALHAATKVPKRSLLFAALPVIFFAIHLSYGVGTICGVVSGFLKSFREDGGDAK